MSWRKVYFSALAVFLSGTIFGLVMGPLVHHFLRGDRPPLPPPPFGMAPGDGPRMGSGPGVPPNAREMRKHLLNRLSEELELSEEQQEKIDPILTDLDRQMNRLRLEMQPRLAQAVDAAVVAGRPILDAEQQKKLEEHYQHLLERWKRERERTEQ